MKMRLNGRNRSFLGIRLALLFVTALLLSVNAQFTNVTARDPRINYVGDWVDQDNGGHKFTAATGSSLSFTFQGSSILWYSSKDPRGGVASVSVDRENLQVVDASVGTATDDNSILEVLFSRSNLDSSKEHTLNISYIGPGTLGGPYVTIFLLAFSTSESITTSVTANAVNSGQSLAISKTTSKTIVEVTQTSTKKPSTTSTSAQSTSSLSTTSSHPAATLSGSSSTRSSSTFISTMFDLPTTSTDGFGTGALSSTLSSPIPSSSSSPSSEAAAAALQTAQRMNLILGAVLGPIGGFLLIGVITLLVVLCRRRNNRFPRERDTSHLNDVRDSSTHTRTGFGGKLASNRPLFTPSIRAAGFTNLESGAQPIARTAPSVSDTTGYFGGQPSMISDPESSPPKYSAS